MVNKLMRFRENPIWRFLLGVQKYILIFTCLLCMLIFAAEVVARYILKVDFLGYDEIILLFATWLYFIGGAYAMYDKSHISADMLGLILKGRKLAAARLIVSWLTMLICIVLAYWGVDFFFYALDSPSQTTVWKIPKICAQSALMVGYIFMAFYAFAYAFEDTVKFIRKEVIES